MTAAERFVSRLLTVSRDKDSKALSPKDEGAKGFIDEDGNNRAESAIETAIEYLEKEGEEVQRNPFRKGWAIKEGYGKDGKQIKQISSEKGVKDELYEALVADEALPDGQTLQEHDKRHHPKGYHEGDTCKFRERIMEETEADKGDILDKDKSSVEQEPRGVGETKIVAKGIVSSEEDKKYLDAVAKGDMKTAQKMVDSVAKRYFGDSAVQDKVWHNTKKKFTEFKNSFPNVFFFAKDKKWADKFGAEERYSGEENTKAYYVEIKKPIDMTGEKSGEEWLSFFKDKGIEVGGNGREKLERFGDRTIPGYAILNHDSAEPNGTGFRDALVKAGYDGAILEDIKRGTADRTSYGVFDSRGIKSADAVTYDDNGNVIPLSRRFDEGVDIRGDISGTPSEQQNEKTKQDNTRVYEGLSNKQVKRYKELMDKKHPEFDADLVLTELGKIKDRKVQECAFGWAMKGAIKLPEDTYKVEEAIKRGEEAFNAFTGAKKTMEAADTTIAKAKEALEAAAGDSKKEDRARQRLENAEKRIKAAKDTLEKYGDVSFNPMDYDTPMGMIEAMHGFKRTEKPITVEELKKNPLMSDYRDEGYGVETFQVEDSREGQSLMRQVLNTHWGKDANPWCLLHGDGEGNLSDGSDGGYNAWEFWEKYNALPKRVAFKDGKLLAFMGTDAEGENYIGDEELKERFPQYVDEYKKHPYWYDGFEGFMRKEHKDELKGIDRVPEQWWDRKDNSHSGIPIGEIEVPNDELHRIAEGEIIGGKIVIPEGQMKHIGEEGKLGYKKWDGDDTLIYEINENGDHITYNRFSSKKIPKYIKRSNGDYEEYDAEGNLESIKRIGDLRKIERDTPEFIVWLIYHPVDIFSDNYEDDGELREQKQKYKMETGLEPTQSEIQEWNGEEWIKTTRKLTKPVSEEMISLPNGTKIKKVLSYLYTDSNGQLHDEKWSVAREKKLGDGRISKEFSDVLDTLLSGKDVSDEAIMSLPEWKEAMELEKDIEGRLQKEYGVTRTQDINTKARNRFRDAIVEAALSDHITKTVPIEGYDGEVFETNEGLEEGESYDVEKGKKVFIAIGLPAAGKSTTFANPLAKKYNARLCDSDTVKKVLPEFANGYGGNIVHDESTDINERILAEAIDKGDNIVYPILGYKPEKLKKLMQMFKDKGYEVNLCFKDMPANIAKGRLLGRFLQKGRYLPLTCISKAQGKVGDAFEAVKDMADAYIRMSSEPDGSGERIIDSKGSIL